MSKPFKFKEFTVKQDQCAMKIGTDSVLLGAWTSLKNNPFSVLDIGAMLRQSRSKVHPAVPGGMF